MTDIRPGDWELAGTTKMSDGQRRLFNAACGDLARCLNWHGNRLTKDDWRHLLSGTLLGWRTMPGIDFGDGRPGLIMLGGSSLDLSKTQATDAIRTAFNIGDFPEEQRLRCKPVEWCRVVKLARGIADGEAELADRLGGLVPDANAGLQREQIPLHRSRPEAQQPQTRRITPNDELSRAGRESGNQAQRSVHGTKVAA